MCVGWQSRYLKRIEEHDNSAFGGAGNNHVG